MPAHAYSPPRRRRPPWYIVYVLKLLRWVGNFTRFWIYTGIFFVLMVLTSYWLVGRYIQGTEFEAPDLTGLTVLEAMSRLNPNAPLPMFIDGQATQTTRRLGISLLLDRTQAHESAPKGTIIGQFPGPGRKIKAGSPMKVVISDGPPLVSVPELKGQSFVLAGVQLRGAQLEVGNVATIPLPDQPGGRVLASDPPGGTGVNEGSRVNLLVTAGESQTGRMPNLTGWRIEDAQDTLQQLGFRVEASPGAGPAGTGSGLIFEQEPAADAEIARGTLVRLVYQSAEAEAQRPPAGPAVDIDGTREPAAEPAEPALPPDSEPELEEAGPRAPSTVELEPIIAIEPEPTPTPRPAPEINLDFEELE